LLLANTEAALAEAKSIVDVLADETEADIGPEEVIAEDHAASGIDAEALVSEPVAIPSIETSAEADTTEDYDADVSKAVLPVLEESESASSPAPSEADSERQVSDEASSMEIVSTGDVFGPTAVALNKVKRGKKKGRKGKAAPVSAEVIAQDSECSETIPIYVERIVLIRIF
jgi:hypothetical protein